MFLNLLESFSETNIFLKITLRGCLYIIIERKKLIIKFKLKLKLKLYFQNDKIHAYRSLMQKTETSVPASKFPNGKCFLPLLSHGKKARAENIKHNSKTFY